MATIYLLQNVDLDNTYEHTLDFENETAQSTYFSSKIFTSWDTTLSFSYLRENRPIKVGKNVDNLFGCNYLMYRNTILNKWFYCFITRKEYINESTTMLYIQTDVMQTFMFDYSIINSFIVREHQDRWVYNSQTQTYTPKFNLQQENLNIGDTYKYITTQILAKDGDVNFLDKQVKWLVFFESTESQNVDNYCFNPYNIYVVPFVSNLSQKFSFVESDDAPITYSLATANEAYTHFVDMPSILGAYITPALPYGLTVDSNYNVHVDTSKLSVQRISWPASTSSVVYAIKIANSNFNYINYDLTYRSLNKSAWLEYSPNLQITAESSINNESKLFTYPYIYYELTDFQSEPCIYYNEYIPDSFNLNYVSSISDSYKIRYYIENYNNSPDAKNYCYISQSNNEIPLINDAWKNYVQTRRTTAITGLFVNTFEGIAKTGAFALAGMPVAGVASSAGVIGNIINFIGQEQQIKKIPDNIKQYGNNGNFAIVDDNIFPRITLYAIQDQFKNVIYLFFQKYGYKCNESKVPDTQSRYYYNYIQTSGCEIEANIDQEYMDLIKGIYDKGITIWHYRDSNTFKGIGNYDYENVEMSIYNATSGGNT